VQDPDSVAWETFVTHGDITYYGNDIGRDKSVTPPRDSRCCA